MRARWDISGATAIPSEKPVLPHAEGVRRRAFGYRPSAWPTRLLEPVGGSMVKVQRDPDFKKDEWISLCEDQWAADMRRLRGLSVPTPLDRPGDMGRLLWEPFLSLCVLYDPPASQLLDFASLNPGVSLEGPLAKGVEGPNSDAPLMIAPPILWVEDAQEMGCHLAEYFDALLSAVAEEPELKDHGIDLDAIVQRVAAQRTDLQHRLRSQREEAHRRPLIEVTPETTDEDVRNAARLLKANLPKPPRSRGRSARHPLICVQCAIWYDGCGWSLERIGKRCNWASQYQEKSKPRCETAREHINEGRAMLEQRKAAA